MAHKEAMDPNKVNGNVKPPYSYRYDPRGGPKGMRINNSL